MRKTDIRVVAWLGLALVGAILPSSAAAAVQTPIPVPNGFLALLANPNVAYVLLVMGLLGLIAEFATAGAVFPGVSGAICLVLALIGLGQMPTNWGGAVLIAAGLVMFLLDIKLAGFALSIGGVIAFTLGSLLLFTPPWVIGSGPAPRVNLWLILGMTAGVSAFFILGIAAVFRSRVAPLVVGRETLIGRVGEVRQELAPSGIVHLDGEEWSAVAALGAPIVVGARVRVIALDGLSLVVEPAGD